MFVKELDWSAFWRKWLGKNEVVASVESSRKQMLRSVKREIDVQIRKRDNITDQIASLNKDKQSVLTVIDLLNAQKETLEKK